VQAALRLSNSGLGLALLGGPVGVVLAMVLSTRLLPRLGSRRGVRLGIAGYCLCGQLVALAGTPVALFGALLLWSSFQALLDVSMNAQGIAVERRQERRLMPGWHGGWSIGAFLGAGIGAAAVSAGVSLGAQLAVMAVPLIALVWGVSRSMVEDLAPDLPAGAHVASPRRALLTPTVLSLAAVAFAGLLCEGAASDWAAVYLRRGLHTSPGFAGLGYTAFALAMVAVRLSGNRVLARWPARSVISALAALATIGLGAALAAGQPVLTLVGFACLGAGLGLVVPSMFSAAGRLRGVPVASGVSAVAALSYCGLVLGPPLIGSLAGAMTLRSALVVLPLCTAAIAVLSLRAPALR
jgi:predicted MFS family arabinose efflux permease